MKKIIPYLSLFTSFGTLICCALPALFVTLGMGATVAATVSTFPQLIWLSENKEFVFAVAGIMLSASFFVQIYARDLTCPTDPILRDACIRGRKFTSVTVIVSAIIYLTGAYFAFMY